MYLSENHSSNLIFPIKNQPKQGEKERVSEQELRQCFISQLSKTDYYSIETPTKKKYKFTTDAKGFRSGSLDLCLFYIDTNKEYVRKNCIEFKAHNMAKTYIQDFMKLSYEEGDNYYIHLLESCNNGTLIDVKKMGKEKDYYASLRKIYWN